MDIDFKKCFKFLGLNMIQAISILIIFYIIMILLAFYKFDTEYEMLYMIFIVYFWEMHIKKPILFILEEFEIIKR